MADSLERIIPALMDEQSAEDQQTLALHLERYRFAAQHGKGEVIADLACGVGYGSAYIADTCREKIRKIYAADIDADSIAYAQQHYASPLIEFIQQDLYTVVLPEMPDTIISLETIEHLPDPQAFVMKMTAVLKPGGRFIASAPVTPSVDANPFHLHDFSPRSFRALFENAGLKELASMQQVQSYNPFQLASGKTHKGRALRKNLLAYYIKHPSKFFLRLRSLFTDGFRNKYLVVVFEKANT